MSLTITVQLPADVEAQVRAADPNLDSTAAEALLVTLFRRRQLTHHQLAQSLGLDRFETEEVLHRHNVTEDLGTLQDYLDDIQTLEKIERK